MEKTNNQQKRTVSQKVSTVIGVLICLILLPMLAMNVTIIVKSYMNPDKIPDFFGIKPFVVLSGSMEPMIHTGDLIVSKIVDPATLKVNDIISYKEGKSVVTHRIMELTEKDGKPAFVTRGDANNTIDKSPITYAQIEGIYLFKIDKLGDLAMFMQTPIGMMIFVGIPLCCFVLYDIIRRKLAEKKEKAELNDVQAEIERLKAELEQKSEDNKE